MYNEFKHCVVKLYAYAFFSSFKTITSFPKATFIVSILFSKKDMLYYLRADIKIQSVLVLCACVSVLLLGIDLDIPVKTFSRNWLHLQV